MAMATVVVEDSEESVVETVVRLAAQVAPAVQAGSVGAVAQTEELVNAAALEAQLVAMVGCTVGSAAAHVVAEKKVASEETGNRLARPRRAACILPRGAVSASFARARVAQVKAAGVETATR